MEENTRLHRSMGLEARASSEERTFDMAISSEMPVERAFGNEILVHSDDSVDLEFLNSGRAPLLLNHNHSDQIGVIKRAYLQDGKLRAEVRFSKSARGQEIQADVEDGIRVNVSIGYEIRQMQRADENGDVRVTGWFPYETSMVSVPADISVGHGRSQEPEMAEKETRAEERVDAEAIRKEAKREIEAKMAEERKLEAEAKAQREAAEAEIRADVEREVREREEIKALGARWNLQDLAEGAIKEGRSLAEFKGLVVDKTDGAPMARDHDIGLTKREKQQFSIINLARGMAQPERADEIAGFEFEVCRAAADARVKANGRTASGIVLPTDVLDEFLTPEMLSGMGRAGGKYAAMARTLSVGNDGDLVATEHESARFIDVLRNRMSVMQAGASMLAGLEGDVDIPKKATASASSWLASEGANVVESEPTFTTVQLTPKDLGHYTDITRRMTQQSSPAIEGIVRMDIATGVALGIDLAALEGSGSSGVPRGVKNTVGINAPTSFAAANPTYAEVVAMETAVADDNALMGNLAYIGTTNMYGALKTTTKDSGSGQFVVEPGGSVNGYNYIRSNQVTSGDLYFANWSDLLIGMWGGLDLDRDTAALFLSGGIRMRAIQTVDVAVRHPVSFAVNNDGV